MFDINWQLVRKLKCTYPIIIRVENAKKLQLYETVELKWYDLGELIQNGNFLFVLLSFNH